jgi:hypothetical protein
MLETMTTLRQWVATEIEAFFAFCRKMPALSQQLEEILEKIFGILPESSYLCNVDWNRQRLSDNMFNNLKL